VGVWAAGVWVGGGVEMGVGRGGGIDT